MSEDQTPNHEYNTPEEGRQNWHDDLNDNFAALDVDVELRGERPPDSDEVDPEPGAKYLDTETGIVYLGTEQAWQATFAQHRVLSNQTSDNLVLGHPNNFVDPQVIGSVISGGGFDDGDENQFPNSVLGSFGTIGGGLGNFIADEAEDGTVSGGFANVVGADGGTVSGGLGNVASGEEASISGGLENTASGRYSAVSGGRRNTASGRYATVLGGRGATATHYGQLAHASGSFGDTGDALSGTYTLQNETNTADETVELYLDGPGDEGARLTIETGRSLAFEIQVVGRARTGETGSWHFTGAIKNDVFTVEFVGTPDETSHVDDDLGEVTIVADDANDALVVEATAAAANTEDTRWVATVETTETQLPEL